MIHTNAYHRIVKNLRSNGSFFVVFLCLPFFWEFWPYFIFAGFVFISLALFFKSIFLLFLMFPGFFCIICLSRKSWWFNQSMKSQNFVFFFSREAEKKYVGVFFCPKKFMRHSFRIWNTMICYVELILSPLPYDLN